MTNPVTRRNMIVGLSGAVPAIALMGRAAAQQATPALAGIPANAIGVAGMPDWTFTVLEYHDPYPGKLTKPAQSPVGLRIVSAQVILTNHSNLPLEFTVTAVRLRDTDGVEYRAGDYLGSEPRLVSQNLPSGERTRGWVWFALGKSASPSSLAFNAPAPILRVTLKP